MRARGVAPGMALPRLLSSQISRRIASSSGEPGTNRREYASSGWSVISQHRRSTPMSAASSRARVHLLVAVVPVEQDVAPVEERQVAAGAALLVRHRAQVGDRDVEPAALPVLHVAVRRRAVDRERHLVDARVHEPARLRLGERQAVGAGVEIDVREVRLDVLAHLDRALVQERLAVVEEVDADERRRRLRRSTRRKRSKSSMPAWRVRVMPVSGAQHACGAGDVAGGGALDVHPRRQRAGVDRPHRRLSRPS